MLENLWEILGNPQKITKYWIKSWEIPENPRKIWEILNNGDGILGFGAKMLGFGIGILGIWGWNWGILDLEVQNFGNFGIWGWNFGILEPEEENPIFFFLGRFFPLKNGDLGLEFGFFNFENLGL